MSKKVKIFGFTILFLVAIIVLIHFQAKRLVLELIASNSSGRIEVGIGSLRINPFRSSIRLRDVWVKVKDDNSENYKRSSAKKAFLDVASLWDFYSGGTLVIEKLELEGGEILLYNNAAGDTTQITTFDLNSIIQRIETDAKRFQITDIAFIDFTIIMMKDSTQVPTTIKHLQVRAHDLYLNADSIFKKKPLIEFSLPGQTILSSKGLSFGFDSLFFSTSDNSVQLNKLKLSSPVVQSGNAYQLNADRVRIAHFDFETLYKKGIVVIDSVFLGQSKLTVNWTIVPSEKGKTKSSGLPSIPEIDIGHLIVNDLASNVTVHQDSIENSFNIDDTFVMVERFRHNPDSAKVITAKDFNIIMARYSTFLSNKNRSISFDTIQLQKNKLSLLNFKFGMSEQKEPLLQTSRFELNQIDWQTLLINKKLVAREARILNPIIYAYINSNSNSASGDSRALFYNLHEFLNVPIFSLTNATAYVKIENKDIDISLKGAYATLHVVALLESTDINQRLQSLERFWFHDLTVTHPEFIGRIDNFSFGRGLLFLGKLDYHMQDRLHFSTSDMTLGNIVWNQSRNDITINGLGWNAMNVHINGDKQVQTKKDDAPGLPGIRINQIKGGNTKLEFNRQQLVLSTLLNQFNFEELRWDKSIQVRGIAITGSDIDFHSSPNIGSVGAYSFNDHGGTFEKIQFNRTIDSLKTFIDQIAFHADMQALMSNHILIDDILVEGMNTRYLKTDSAQQLIMEIDNTFELKELRYHENKIMIQSLLMESGPVNLLHTKEVRRIMEPVNTTKIGKRRFSIGVDSLFQGNNSLRTLQQKQNNLAQRNEPATDSSQFVTQSTSVKSEHGGIRLSLSTVEVDLKDSIKQIKAKVNSLTFNQVNIKNNNLTALVETGSFNDIVINSNTMKNPQEWMYENYPTAGINNLKARVETNGNLIQVNQLDYDPVLMRGNISGFEFRPLKSKQEVLDQSYYQTNYMRTKVDSVSFEEFSIKEFLEDTVLHLKSLYVSSPTLEIHRDKTHPFFSTDIKLLPTNAFKNIGLKFKIDTLQFNEGKISYTEKSRITEKEGTLHFTQLQGTVTNIKNIDLHENDSLYINANTRFLDSAKVVLRVKESYQDTLGGFLLSTNVSPFNTSILNKALVPLVAVEFQSGYVDTLLMHAIGREFISLGTMKFLYHDLKVKFLDKNDTSRHSLKNQLLKIAANTFVIRTKNTKRLGTVYYERDRNRAVFQYWVKMILSGATTSVGAKSNRKQVKKYMKDLDQRKLPSIKNDFTF